MSENSARRDLNDPNVSIRFERLEMANTSLEATSAGDLVDSGNRLATENRTRRIPEHEHSPIYWTNIVFTVYSSGDWEITCNAEDRSRHSDWDVWLDLWIFSTISNAKVCDIAAGVCFQDLDAGENYNKHATGYSSCIRDNWTQIANGNFYQTFTSWKRRDN
jgi:hypothetical protein